MLFRQIPQDIEVKQADNVTFSCTTKEKTQKVTWCHNHNKIESGEKYTLASEGCTHTLTITNCEIADAGEVVVKTGNETCTAKLGMTGTFSIN